MRHPHLLTILYVNQQSINKVPKIWGQPNEKGNGGSPDPFLARLRRALRKKGLAHKTMMEQATRLQMSRKAYKSHVTRQFKKVEELMAIVKQLMN